MANINKQPLDKNGLRHGEWITYYPNNQLYFRGNYVHGNSHGLLEWYHNDGRLMARGRLNMGREIGYWYHSYKQNEYCLWLI